MITSNSSLMSNKNAVLYGGYGATSRCEGSLKQHRCTKQLSNINRTSIFLCGYGVLRIKKIVVEATGKSVRWSTLCSTLCYHVVGCPSFGAANKGRQCYNVKEAALHSEPWRAVHEEWFAARGKRYFTPAGDHDSQNIIRIDDEFDDST